MSCTYTHLLQTWMREADGTIDNEAQVVAQYPMLVFVNITAKQQSQVGNDLIKQLKYTNKYLLNDILRKVRRSPRFH